MKKYFFINTILVAAFILSDPLLSYLGVLADIYSLGAEIVLGNCLPLILLFFIFAAMHSVVRSIINCYKNKDVKQLLPNVVLIIGFAAYVFIFKSNSLWWYVIDFYLNARYLV